MHIFNKNVIFNLFFSIFAGPYSNGEKAQNPFNYHELKEINSKPKREPKGWAQDLENSTRQLRLPEGPRG